MDSLLEKYFSQITEIKFIQITDGVELKGPNLDDKSLVSIRHEINTRDDHEPIFSD